MDTVLSIDLPTQLHEQITAACEAGFYASESELVIDAVHTLLAAHPDLRVAIACQLYAQGTISLGRAAELAGIDIVSFKRVLHERGLPRTASGSLTEIVEMAHREVSYLVSTDRPDEASRDGDYSQEQDRIVGDVGVDELYEQAEEHWRRTRI